MPTGYTEGIIDGTVTTFQQFAKLCVRNFGAAIHMRDDPMGTEFKERTPSEYYITKIAEANKLLSDARLLSDTDIIARHAEEILKSKLYHLNAIEQCKLNQAALTRILNEVLNYEPPTPKHDGIKTFMEEQINSTITHDCDTEYHETKLAQLDEQLKMSVNGIRVAMIDKAAKDLSYHQGEHTRDIRLCQEANEWVKQFFNSIK